MKIVVLGGGLSPERDVSLKSASLIANALLSKGHEVAMIDLYDGIENDRPAESFFRRGTVNPYTYTIPENEPDLEEIPASVRREVEFIPVSDFEEVIPVVIQ